MEKFCHALICKYDVDKTSVVFSIVDIVLFSRLGQQSYSFH